MTAQPTLFDPNDFADGWRECPRCVSLGFPGRFPDVFFRKLHGTVRTGKILPVRRAKICIGCEDELSEDRSLIKSLNQRIRDHARRHGTPIKTYRTRYNLASSTVLDWWKAKIRGGVLDCGCLVSEMRHGTKDIELHQLDPREPFFPDTWRLVCTNDHRGMQHPDYPAIKRGWQLWKQSRE
jgi:hypothetical protein